MARVRCRDIDPWGSVGWVAVRLVVWLVVWLRWLCGWLLQTRIRFVPLHMGEFNRIFQSIVWIKRAYCTQLVTHIFIINLFSSLN